MSLTRRILESARAGLSTLTSLVIVDDEPLSSVEAAALEVELAARKKAHTGEPGRSAIAKLAGPGARADRARQAAERAHRINGAAAAKAAAAKRAADDAFRRMKAEAARGDAGASGATGSSRSNSGGQRTGRPKPGSTDAQLAEWYRVLNLSPGADPGEIKSAYRQLMRRYHPDMHAANPAKQKAANELSMRVTAAYNGLQEHLNK
ncbi:MAG: J domain-containing protein [Myxococcales bacterium]|nr:J domain-containing protein [Myxococcales bacterium]